MLLLAIGVLLLGLKWGAVGPFAELSWWWVWPWFVATVVWWEYSDGTGLTRKRAMKKMEERKAARRERDMENLGLNSRRDKRVEAAREAARAAEEAKKKAGG
jgi:small Trp-rich protein